MAAHHPTDDPVAGILTRHGAPSVASLAEDIAGTYLRIADMLGVRRVVLPCYSERKATRFTANLARSRWPPATIIRCASIS